MAIHGFLKASVLWIATLIIADTMAMLWKAKETVLNGVFSLEPPLEEGEIVIELDEPDPDDEPPEDADEDQLDQLSHDDFAAFSSFFFCFFFCLFFFFFFPVTPTTAAASSWSVLTIFEWRARRL